MSATATESQRVARADLAHVFHSWSAQAPLAPMVIAGGSGSTLWDHDGRRYLDFSSQLVNVNIGYQHPRVVAAIVEQANLLTTISPATANATRAQAAELIIGVAPEGFEKVFFTNGGADANENAMRMARLITGRDKVLSRYRSYHGNTGAAVVATGDWRRIPNEFARGHVHVFGPYLYRSEFWAQTSEQECERALHHLERVVQAEGAETIAAILLETVPGTAGILPPPHGYLRGVQEIADRYGIMLILDEVMAGFGRTGEWFALDAYDVLPDLITFAKGVNSGYVPVGGVLIPNRHARHFDEHVFPGGLTYSGHPLGAASIVATIGAMRDEDVIAHARSVGTEILGPGLRELMLRHDAVGEVRGAGVFWAVELVADRDTREPWSPGLMAQLKTELRSGGLLPMIVDNRLHVVPPCVIRQDEASNGIDIIDRALRAVGSGPRTRR